MTPKKSFKINIARVAELVDALDLGASGFSRGGSSPPSRTRREVGPAEILIDGYNLLGIYHSDLAAARRNLITLLSKYRAIRGHSITVVFDAYRGMAPKGRQMKEGGIRIIYTPAAKKADDVIKEIILREKRYFVVISSDRQVADFAWSKGCVPVRSEDFLKRLEEALRGEDREIPLYSHQPGKGKGVSHRLSKRQKAIVRTLNKL